MTSNIKCTIRWTVSFWEAVTDLYRQQKFCDLAIVCSDGHIEDYVVKCHKLVIGAISPKLADHFSDSDLTSVQLPDYSYSDVSGLIDCIYSILSGQGAHFPWHEHTALIKDLGLNFTFEHLRRSRKNAKSEVDFLQCFNNSNNGVGMWQDDGSKYEQETPSDCGSGNEPEWLLKEEKTKKCKTSKTRRKRKAPQENDGVSKHAITLRKKALSTAITQFEVLKGQMSTSNGSYEVELSDIPVDIGGYYRKKQAFHARIQATQNTFEAFVGLKRDNATNEFTAMPISWTSSEEDDISEQYRAACDAFYGVLGLSKSDMFYNSLTIRRMGLQNDLSKRRLTFRRRYAKFTDVELKEELKEEDIQNLIQHLPPKQLPQLQSGSSRVTLARNMNVSDIENIGLLSFPNSGAVRLEYVFPEACTEPDTTFGYCVMAKLFDNWCKFSPTVVLPPHQAGPLVENYNEIKNALWKFKAIEYLQDDVDGSRKAAALTKTDVPDKLCPHCGGTFSDYIALSRHIKTHKKNLDNCGCGYTHASEADRDQHCLESHSTEYSQCEKCSKVFKKIGMHRHKCPFDPRTGLCEPVTYKKRKYSEFVKCEDCGKQCRKGQQIYNHHYLHHKPSKCKFCPFTALGVLKLKEHTKQEHKSLVYTVQCPDCGNFFESVYFLRLHAQRAHPERVTLPIRCEQEGCTRTFSFKSELKQHMIMAHIKSRPYVCRHGCGAAFNQGAGLFTHEKNKHGFATSVHAKDFDLPDVDI